METIIILSLVGVAASVIVGTVWYMPKTPMGKLHMRFLGFDKLTPEQQQQKMNDAKPHMPKVYGAQMVLSLLTSFAVVFIVSMTMQNGQSFSSALGFVLVNWFCFMVPVIGGTILWGNVERAIAWKKFFSDISYHLVTVVVVAVIASLFV